MRLDWPCQIWSCAELAGASIIKWDEIFGLASQAVNSMYKALRKWYCLWWFWLRKNVPSFFLETRVASENLKYALIHGFVLNTEKWKPAPWAHLSCIWLWLLCCTNAEQYTCGILELPNEFRRNNISRGRPGAPCSCWCNIIIGPLQNSNFGTDHHKLNVTSDNKHAEHLSSRPIRWGQLSDDKWEWGKKIFDMPDYLNLYK